jgi:hypothetical protein
MPAACPALVGSRQSKMPAPYNDRPNVPRAAPWGVTTQLDGLSVLDADFVLAGLVVVVGEPGSRASGLFTCLSQARA